MPSIAQGWFADRAPGRGLITLLTPPAPAGDCVYDEAPVNLGNLASGSGSAAWGTSQDGSFVVGFGLDSGAVQRGLTWTNQGAPAQLSELATATATQAFGCSYDGSIIVGRSVVGGDDVPTVWTGGTPAALELLPTGLEGAARYCNSDGTIIVGNCTATSGGALTLITSTLKQSSDNNTVTTDAVDTTGADLIVIVVASVVGVAETISDNKSNTWVALTSHDNGSNSQGTIYYSVNPTVGTGHTFTNACAAGAPALAVAAYSGAHLTTPFDQQNGNANTSGTTITTGSVTPTENNEVIIYGLTGAWTGTASINVGTILQQAAFPGSNAYGIALAHEIQTTLAARNATWTSSSNEKEAVIASFKAAASATTINAVYWENGTIADLGNIGSTTIAQGCSADGSIVVGYGAKTGGGTLFALKWTNGAAPVELGTLSGGTDCRAFKCSADGSIIVGTATDSGGVPRAVYWDGTGIHELDIDAIIPETINTIATGVSSDGTVIGGYTQTADLNYWPVMWRNTAPTFMRIGNVSGSELITNGTFTGGVTGWTLGTDVAYASDHVTSTYAGGDPFLTQSTVAMTSAKIYEVIFTVSGNSPAGNGTYFYFTNNSFEAPSFYGNGTWSVVFLADNTSTDTITFDDWGYVLADVWTLDSVSMKELTATARPSINLEVQNISPNGEVIVGQGNYNSGSFPVGALEWLCVT